MNQTLELFIEITKGKCLGRIRTNQRLRGRVLGERVLEAGAGRIRRPSYWRFLDASKMLECVTLDVSEDMRPDIIADANKILPFPDARFDTVICCNMLEHLLEPEKALSEFRRVLAAGGTLIGCVPFLVEVHGDPNDYRRFTAEMLTRMFTAAGFKDIRVEPNGGLCIASYSLFEPFIPAALRFITAPLTLAAETIARFAIDGRNRKRGLPELAAQYPVDYVFEAKA